jgi:hypothetical protein
MRKASNSRIVLARVMMTVLAMMFAAIAGAQEASSLPASSGPNQPQVVQPDQGGVNWKGVGVGAGTVAGNLLYVPAKLTYGILGGIAGGAGFLLTGGNKQVADTIWRSSLGGDYVLTPDMVTGKNPVHFSGPTSTAPTDSSSAGGAPSAYSGAASSSGAPATLTPSSSNLNGSVPATHAIDSGAGPVSGANVPTVPDPATSADSSSSSYSSGEHQAPKLKTQPLPETSIE